MKQLVIYEQASCCITGVCGAKANPEILRISSVAATLAARGIKLEIYNLMRTPQAFAKNKKVIGYVKTHGERALPVCTLDGEIAIEGRYPTNEEIIDAFELEATALDKLLPPGRLVCEI